MKTLKWIPLILLFPVLFLITGCPNPTDPDEIPTPSNVTIVATTDGLGVYITWNEVTDVDGYDVVTPDGHTEELEADENYYEDTSPAQTGTYTIYCVVEPDRGDGATISSAPEVSTSNLTVYGWNESGDSGFGWNVSTGIGQTYSCVGTTNSGVIDFFFYDQGTYYHFISGDEDPYYGSRTGHIVRMGTSDFDEAPGAGSYANMEDVIAGNYYAFSVGNDYYGKLYVTSALATEATFSYEFQTIQSFRLF